MSPIETQPLVNELELMDFCVRKAPNNVTWFSNSFTRSPRARVTPDQAGHLLFNLFYSTNPL